MAAAAGGLTVSEDVLALAAGVVVSAAVGMTGSEDGMTGSEDGLTVAAGVVAAAVFCRRERCEDGLTVAPM